MPDSIAHYRLGPKLGQGAMGEVYRATDTKLGRDVAIKLIAPTLAQDAARMSSFAREAHVLASLNHPNIAAIYGIEDQALVMELVEGPTLAERIKKGPIPLDEALGIARQIADGLESAHDKGIVHRDLKPGNIKITPDGTVKLLDFGLAKAAAVASAPADEAMTIALSMTGGLIVGTPGYMAPEQARGKPVDKRADIWAFGVVLYEMLTGTTLFEGDTVTDVMASVVRQDPDLTRVPASVRPLLRRCLEKDPKRRLRDVGDAMLLIEPAPDAATSGAPAHGRTMLWPAWAAAAVLLLALIGLSLVHFRERAPVLEAVRFKIALPDGVTFTPLAQFAISPDGRKLAFVATGADRTARVWLQPIDTLEPRPIAGGEITPNTGLLVWSPDSRFLVTQQDQKLKRIDTTGGPAQTIGDHQGPAFGGSWHANGTIIFGSLAGVMQVSASGGTPAFVTKTDTTRREIAAFPAFLPDGRNFLYMRGGPVGQGQRGLYVGSLDAKPEAQPATPIVVTDLGGGVVLLPGSSTDLRVLFVRDDTLVSQRFDAAQQKLVGDAEPVAQQVLFADFPYAVSGNTLVYRTGTIAGRTRRMTWLDREGKTVGTVSEVARYNVLKLSPDTTRAVTSRLATEIGSNNSDLWITDFSQDASTRFTFDPEPDVGPAWSPDGKQIAWVGVRKGTMHFFRKPADGGGQDELLYKFDGDTPVNMTDWSADGRYLIYNRSGDVYAMPVEGTESTRKPILVVQTSGVDFGAYVSPDSRWISYISNESGRQEIYVQPFAPGWQNASGATPLGGKWMVSRGALGMNRWRADSKELLYVAADGELMSVDVTPTPVFKASAPRPLFQLPRPFLDQGQNPGAIADVSRDLRRILLVLPSEAASRQEMMVVLNWQSGLAR